MTVEQALAMARRLREELHGCPELSGQERKTQEVLKAFLRENTTLELVEREGWFYAAHREGEGLPNVAWRCDMDAIPGEEGPYHGCGHDGHCAAAAGLALLAEGKTLGRNLFFLFQPAEETGEGARRCLPFLQEEGIGRIFGFHNIPGFPLGAVLCREGTFACASRGLTIRLTGKQSHAAYPELGTNPAFLAAGLLEGLPALLAPERWKGLVLATVVQVAVGEKAFGVSAGEGEVSLTLRAHLGEELEQLQEEIQAYVTREGARQGIASRFVVQDAFPHTASTPALEARLEDAWRRKGLQVLPLEEPMRWSEDFGWYLGQVPGVFFGIGAGEACPGLHTPDYSFPDELLPAALKAGQTALLLD